MQTEARRERTGSSRIALVTALLAEHLAGAGTTAVVGQAAGARTADADPGSATATRYGGSPRVLDCGGGSGAYAVPLAVLGADVTVVDISADALATLRRRAEEAGASATVHAIAGDVEALAGLMGEQRFDAVLAHGILGTGDSLAPAEETFAAMVSLLRPGGLLSVLVANPLAAVVARALAGDPAAALAELRRLDDGLPVGRVDPEAVVALGARAGLTVVARHGIGVFSDLVPGSAGETALGRDAVADLDAAVAARSPFAELAGRVHLLLRRPPS